MNNDKLQKYAEHAERSQAVKAHAVSILAQRAIFATVGFLAFIAIGTIVKTIVELPETRRNEAAFKAVELTYLATFPNIICDLAKSQGVYDIATAERCGFAQNSAFDCSPLNKRKSGVNLKEAAFCEANGSYFVPSQFQK